MSMLVLAQVSQAAAVQPCKGSRSQQRQLSLQQDVRSRCLCPSTATSDVSLAAAAGPAVVPVTFSIAGTEATVDAQPGENIWEVAKRAGADIPLGCSSGSCGICEVEVYKYSSSGSSSSSGPSVGVVRACIAGIPPGYRRLEVREVPLDDIWGVDGFDT